MRQPRDWFASRRLGAGVTLLAEPGHVNCFLVEGGERALLFDTGTGIADIRAVASRYTELPIVAVSSHGHHVHRGGNALFDTVACHPLAAASLTEDVPASSVASYAATASEMVAAVGSFAAADERFLHLLTEWNQPRPLPEGAAGGWHVPGRAPDLLLEDGDEIDLGGRRLRVLHTPGHSPDSLCLWDASHGILFAGDTLAAGDMHVHDLTALRDSLHGLCRLAADLEVAYVGHAVQYAVDSRFLRRASAAVAIVRADLPDGPVAEPSRDRSGSPVRRYRYPDFDLLLPAA